jgi:hypothetical protein
MFGFVEGFSGDYFCAICYATQNDIQILTRERYLNLRNRQDYTKYLEKLEFSGALHG